MATLATVSKPFVAAPQSKAFTGLRPLPAAFRWVILQWTMPIFWWWRNELNNGWFGTICLNWWEKRWIWILLIRLFPYYLQQAHRGSEIYGCPQGNQAPAQKCYCSPGRELHGDRSDCRWSRFHWRCCWCYGRNYTCCTSMHHLSSRLQQCDQTWRQMCCFINLNESPHLTLSHIFTHIHTGPCLWFHPPPCWILGRGGQDLNLFSQTIS